MKKTALACFFFIAITLAWDPLQASSQTIYKSTNKVDFIKIDKAKKDEKKEGLNHPHTFPPEQMQLFLSSLKLNRKILLLGKTENRDLFGQNHIEFLSPLLVEAFQKVGPQEVVVVSYFTRDSKFLIQNDRLTVFRAYLKKDGLHLKFGKLYAKMLGDRTMMGTSRTMNEAKGIGVGLELQPGQNRISWKPEELVLDLAAPQPVAAETIQKEPLKEPVKEFRSVKERLKELEQLKKEEIISEKEYQRKRKELLRDL